MKKTVALSMIVKNESHIIHECLNSIYKFIDYWVIVDTGSTDGTQDIIKKFVKVIANAMFNLSFYLQRQSLNFLIFIDIVQLIVFLLFIFLSIFLILFLVSLFSHELNNRK